MRTDPYNDPMLNMFAMELGQPGDQGRFVARWTTLVLTPATIAEGAEGRLKAKAPSFFKGRWLSFVPSCTPGLFVKALLVNGKPQPIFVDMEAGAHAALIDRNPFWTDTLKPGQEIELVVKNLCNPAVHVEAAIAGVIIDSTR